MQGKKFAHARSQNGARKGDRRADPQSPARRGLQGPYSQISLLGLIHDTPAAIEVELSDLSGGYSARGSFDEAYTKAVLQPLYSAADAGFWNAKPSSRPSEALRLADINEVLELIEVHCN
jgi:hypothetical protein